MHYQPLNELPAYPIAAVYQNTAPEPTSPWVMPGKYTAKLTVDGKTYSETFSVLMDPRVKTSHHDLQIQHDLSYQCYTDIITAERLKSAIKNTPQEDQKKKVEDISTIERPLKTVLNKLQQADEAPLPEWITTINDAHRKLEKMH